MVQWCNGVLGYWCNGVLGYWDDSIFYTFYLAKRTIGVGFISIISNFGG
jgi:hypothetical protein